MGAFKPPSQIPFWVCFPFLIIVTITITSLVAPSIANDNSDSRNTNNYLSPAPANTNVNAHHTPFKSSIAVIIGVLTSMFSITFLLLLYAKHCKGGNGVGLDNNAGVTPSSTTRKNSGIDRGVVESLPIFRFGVLRGQNKDGLECAVCLAKFEPVEVLRLLPKCKHAFHVECVDTWLDGHSTCPLCRYRVDPEDILLVEDAKISVDKTETEPELVLKPEFRRVSGRHSSAGEFRSSRQNPASFRMSLDGAGFLKKGEEEGESVSVGCFDRPRKDGLLLTDGLMADRKSFERRFEHRIIISAGGGGGGFPRRWSDVQPSDLLYLRSEMLISDSHRFSSGSSRPSVKRQQMLLQQQLHHSIDGGGGGGGSGVINSRSLSEITGLSRFSKSGEESNNIISSNRNDHRQRHAGLVSRWLAWISSRSHSLPAVRSDRTTDIGNIV